MKIKSMQVGGIVYTPFIPNRTQQQQEVKENKSPKEEKIIGTIKKEIIDLLKENGLQNDVDNTLNAAMNFLNSSSNLSNFAIFGGSQSDFSLAQLTQVQSLVNRTKRNKQQYDSASKVLTEQNAWSDVAIDGRGYMYALDKDNKLSKIKANEYAENRDKYQLLDYSSLMHIREQDPNLAYNQSILNDANSAIGIETISDYLVGIVKEFGTESETGYIKKLPQSVQNGLQTLIANGPDGIYKATNETEVKDINNAISYLNDSLNSRMKSTIDAYNAAEGKDATGKGRLKFIYDVITNHTNQKVSVDFDKYATEVITGKGGSEDKKTVQESLAHAYSTGSGLGSTQTIQITPHNTGATLFAQGRLAGPAVDRDKNIIGTTSLQQLLQEAEPLRVSVDAQSITFGDRLLNPNDYEKIMYDGNTQMYRVWLPSKNVNGRVTVDFEAQQKADELMREIKQHGIKDDDQIRYLVEQNIPNATWDSENKMIRFSSTIPFMTFGGYASGKEFNELSDSKYVWNLSRDEGRKIKDKYNNLMKYSNIYGDKTETNVGGKTRSNTNFYQGNIYIPVLEGVAGAIIFDRQYAPQSQFTDISAKADLNNYLNSINNHTKVRSNF